MVYRWKRPFEWRTIPLLIFQLPDRYGASPPIVIVTLLAQKLAVGKTRAESCSFVGRRRRRRWRGRGRGILDLQWYGNREGGREREDTRLIMDKKRERERERVGD